MYIRGNEIHHQCALCQIINAAAIGHLPFREDEQYHHGLQQDEGVGVAQVVKGSPQVEILRAKENRRRQQPYEDTLLYGYSLNPFIV